MASIDDVQDISPRVQYTAIAAQTVFAYPFPIFLQADLVVDVDGALQVLTTDYTVSGAGNETGGNVTFVTAPGVDAVVTIFRDIAVERSTDFQQNGPWSSTTFNDELDKLYLIIQELENKIGRAIRFPITSASTNAQNEMAPISTFFGKFLRVTAAGILEAADLLSNTVAFTAETIGALLYPRTAAEITAGVTPTAFRYEPGHAFRYGLSEAATDSARQTAIQAAFDSSGPVKIPAGTWLTNGAIQWNSNNHIRGEGVDVTIIKLGEAADEDENVIEPKAKDSSIINWSIKDLTFDGNFDRAAVNGSGTRQRPGGSCVSTSGARHGYIHNVKGKDAARHCLDVCNGGEIEGSGDSNYVLSANEAVDYYPSNESQYIDIDNFWAENATDDCITIHYSKDITFGVTVSTSSGAHRSTAAMGVEIDDGSRDITWDRAICHGGSRGFVIKQHDPQPSPEGITVNSIVVEGAQQGVNIAGSLVAGNLLKRINIGQIVVRNPATNTGTAAINGVFLNKTYDTNIGSIMCIATGSESITLEEAVAVGNTSKKINIGQIFAQNWPYNNTADTSLAGVQVTGTCEDVSISQIIMEDCGWYGLIITGSPDRIRIGNVDAVLTSSLSGSIAVKVTGNLTSTRTTVSSITQNGYDLGSSYIIKTPDDNSVQGQPIEDGRIRLIDMADIATGTYTAAQDTTRTDIDSSGGAVTVTLLDGKYDQQRKKFTMSDASNSSTVNVTSHETSDPEIFTFAQTTDTLILEWDHSNAFWWTVKNIGVAT